MDYKVPVFCLLMGFASGLFAQPTENQPISEAATTTNSPLEIEEITISSPERQNELLKGSPITKDVKIAQSPPLNKEALNDLLGFLLWIECNKHSDTEDENLACIPWPN